MTFEEILKSQGLTDDQITTITGEMKSNKIFTSAEENIDIRYQKLKADHDSLTAQHGESTKLIEQLKKGTKDSESLQSKITDYESQITTLQTQLEEQKLESAVKVALLDAKVVDLDYMTFKLKEKGELTLDESGKVKGIDDMLSGLKTQFPTQFESKADQKQIEVQKLGDRDQNQGGGMTRSEFLKKPYNERAEFARENPEAYNTIMGR